MKLFEWCREYAILIVSIILITWSCWRIFKEKKAKNPIAKKTIIAGVIGVMIVIVASFIVLK